MTRDFMESDFALQPTIVGFSLAKLRSLLGSNDLDTAEHLVNVLSSHDEQSDQLPATLEEAARVLRKAISEGVPFPGLISEAEPHVMAAAVLAQCNQDLTCTDSTAWQAGALWALSTDLGEELEPEARQLLAYFCDGRPLFGKAIETERSYYGWLSNREVVTLHRELIALEEHVRDWEDAATLDFLHDLIGWLNSIVEVEQDLWFYVC